MAVQNLYLHNILPFFIENCVGPIENGQREMYVTVARGDGIKTYQY